MAAAALAGAGALSTMAGAQQQGAAGQAAAQYNYQTNQYNAQIAIQQAKDEEAKLRVSARKTIGAARANYGASGVQMEGSPLDVLEESAANAEMDALSVRHRGELKAWSYKANAGLNLLEGESAKAASQIGVTSALLGGAANVYDKWK